MLKFYDEVHIYEYNGVVIPSVSELLRFLSREIYGDINKFILDQAAERGTAVHAATQALDEQGAVECGDDIAGYLDGYVKFLREHKVEWQYIEKPVAHPELLYAGTIDRAGILDGHKAIVDIKTNSAVKKPLVKAQLNGYRKLMEQIGFCAERLFCLQLTRDGKYRFYPTTIDDTEFMACYTLHQVMRRKHTRGKIE